MTQAEQAVITLARTWARARATLAVTQDEQRQRPARDAAQKVFQDAQLVNARTAFDLACVALDGAVITLDHETARQSEVSAQYTPAGTF